MDKKKKNLRKISRILRFRVNKKAIHKNASKPTQNRNFMTTLIVAIRLKSWISNYFTNLR